jgi:uncharacterized RDD family membrane protein YckC
MSTAGAAKASWGSRLIAYIIDIIPLIIVNIILQVILRTSVLGIIVDFAYFGYFWTTTGQTLGAQAMKIQVVRKDSKPIDWTTAIIRYVGYIISGIPLGLGFLWALWDPEQQGWHDKIANTYVVQKS